MDALGEVRGVAVALVEARARRVCPVVLERACATQPYPPSSSRVPWSAPLSPLDEYADEALLRDALACMAVYQAAHPAWWAAQAPDLVVDASVTAWRAAVRLHSAPDDAAVRGEHGRPPRKKKKRAGGAVDVADLRSGIRAHSLYVHGGDAEVTVPCVPDATVALRLPPRSAFMVTDLLPAAPVEPRGWPALCAQGTWVPDRSGGVGRRRACAPGPALAEPQCCACAAARRCALVRHDGRHLRRVARASRARGAAWADDARGGVGDKRCAWSD